MSQPQLKYGDPVVLNVPENPRLHRARATVEFVPSEGWGCHVRTEAASSGRFRALWSELVPVVQGRPPSPTGEACTRCGSLNVVRTGTCLTCRDCFETSGCG